MNMMEARRLLLCDTRGCKFMKNREIGKGTHCCGKCIKHGPNKHGPKCKGHVIEFMKCNRPQCHFMKNPDIFNNGGTHCCNDCKQHKRHGPKCTKQIVGRPAEMKEEKLEVEVLEEFHGINYPGHDIKNFNCGSLREARVMAAQKLAENKHHFCAWTSNKKKLWIKRDAHQNHPKVKNAHPDKHVTLFYRKALFELSHAKCNRRTCNFMKDPNHQHGFCCLLCKTSGLHGPLCKQERMGAVIREERRELKCDRPGCRYTKHPDKNNNGGTHCCKRCKERGGHGGQCKKILVGEVIKNELKCIRPMCNFAKHPDVKNNGGNHCCNACKVNGRHGPACTNKLVGGPILPNLATGRV